MKTHYLASGIFMILISMLFACGGSQKQEKSPENADAIEATFVSATCFEGECDYIFKLADGTMISFFANYTNPDIKELEMEYDLFDNETLSGNQKWVGKTFIIKYKFVEKGKTDVGTGEVSDCNKIVEIKLK